MAEVSRVTALAIYEKERSIFSHTEMVGVGISMAKTKAHNRL
jgi:hypothetical protein